MKWEDRLKELLAQKSINQEDYDEFVNIGNSLTKESDIEKYQEYGEGIYLLLDKDVKTRDDF
jgi:hypothetical protein|tara:strand:+ start:845 stop:1030 length:186 start_codon:yes stop_codon:yes gene_type:complete